MVIAMPSTHSPEPVTTSGGDSSATEHDNDIKSQCNPNTGATVKDNRNKRKEKKSGLSLGSLKSPFKFLGKTYCRGCRKKCSGEVLRVNDVYFHNQCFRCKGCDTNLSQGGFFTKDKEYYCASCYQSNFGTKCNKCGQYVEGEVVTALGKTYHQNCFRCAGCQNPFPTGERVTFTGKNCLCQSCAAKDNLLSSSTTTTKNGTAKTSTSMDMIRNGNGVSGKDSKSAKNGSAKQPTTPTSVSAGKLALDEGRCAGCNAELKDGQALMALDKHYHVWCFKCKACDSLLHGEYMGKDGQPYCEKDYQALFGVKCTYCFRFISGKVLQAGDNNHFHPTCARCTKCGEPFGDGEEMFLQGAAIWHPRCGPSPEESGIVINGSNFEGSIGAASPYPVRGGSGYHHTDVDGASTASELPPHHQAMHASYGAYSSRASSPGGTLRHHRGGGDPMHWRSTSHMAGAGGGNFFMPSLYNSSSTYSLRRPIDAGDRAGSSAHLPHFHLPPSRRSSSSAGDRAGIPPPGSRQSRPGTAMSEVPAGGGFRPVSAPPKPGYTHASVKASTLPVGAGLTAASPAVTSGARTNGNHYDAISQASGRTDFSNDFMRGSNTYSHGFRQGGGGMRAPTPLGAGTVMTEHKIYPLHLLFSTNYKLPPDIDRCNLEKHLSDSDFEMVFNMSRDDFYAMPLWRRNDYKRRVRLF